MARLIILFLRISPRQAYTIFPASQGSYISATYITLDQITLFFPLLLFLIYIHIHSLSVSGGHEIYLYTTMESNVSCRHWTRLIPPGIVPIPSIGIGELFSATLRSLAVPRAAFPAQERGFRWLVGSSIQDMHRFRGNSTHTPLTHTSTQHTHTLPQTHTTR